MPLIEGRLSNNMMPFARELEDAITAATIATLKRVFTAQLGFDSDTTRDVAAEAVGQFAPGWVWLYLTPFAPVIAGERLDNARYAIRLDVHLLEQALDEAHQNAIVQAIAKAVRNVVPQRHLDLAITNLTGNVQMSVPGSPDSLLEANGVHSFLIGEIRKALAARQIPLPAAPTPPVQSTAGPGTGQHRSYYEGLKADYSRPVQVSAQLSDQLLNEAEQYISMMDESVLEHVTESNREQIEWENREWWPTHCEALRQGRDDLLAGEYRSELVYFCKDGPFYGRGAGTEVEASWWKILSQPGVTMCWPIVMFHGDVVYFEWKCVDVVSNETTAKGNVTFLRRGHRGGVYLKTEQLTFYRDVHARFFAT